jgi:UDP-N-acetylmuramoyl-tripeptide--D-alanyl-D-alanine ligase
MGNFDDPFSGYTLLLRIIIYGLIPAFTVWQFFRIRRALHIFQLEGYKPRRFLAWCAAHRRKALWLARDTNKKPLVLTGRATRLLILTTALCPLLVLAASGVAHVALGGWPADVIMWLLATSLVWIFTSHVLVAADVILSPLQSAVNRRFLTRASGRLREVDPTVIGITGSFGKTSTKFAVQGLAGPPGSVLATPGSFNTTLGVSRTINEGLSSEHRVFVVEMGAYGAGDIAELCEFVQPTIAVLTAIGPAHLERFGSMDVIRAAKYELIEALPPDGTAVMNVDDPEVLGLAEATDRVRVLRYGIDDHGEPDVTARDVQVTPSGSQFTIVTTQSGESVRVKTRLLGRHSVGHVLAGTAVALSLGQKLHELVEPIAQLAPVEHRLQLIAGRGGVTVIDDAYNSNPEGAAAALEVLESMPGHSKIVVTPGIIEFGDVQTQANERLGRHAAAVADVLVLVGRLNREALKQGAANSNGQVRVIVVDSLAEATAKLAEIVSPGDVVLFENDLPDQYEN